jgi:hypothetical protein
MMDAASDASSPDVADARSLDATCNGAVIPAPVARYTFDDCDDQRGSLRDSSPYQADANKMGGAAVRCAGGHDGIGVYFNGDDVSGNGYLTVPGPTVPTFSTGLTVSAWLSIWDNRYANIIGRWFDVDSFLLLSDGTDFIFTVARPDGEGGVGLDYHVNTPVVLYRWVHVVAVFNGQLITLYVDGRFAQAALVDPPGPLQQTARPLQMGGLDLAGSYFKGMIDEVMLFDVPLDPAQVRALDCK